MGLFLPGRAGADEGRAAILYRHALPLIGIPFISKQEWGEVESQHSPPRRPEGNFVVVKFLPERIEVRSHGGFGDNCSISEKLDCKMSMFTGRCRKLPTHRRCAATATRSQAACRPRRGARRRWAAGLTRGSRLAQGESFIKCRYSSERAQ
jgi:hypothetical protein